MSIEIRIEDCEDSYQKIGFQLNEEDCVRITTYDTGESSCCKVDVNFSQLIRVVELLQSKFNIPEGINE